MKVLSKDFVIDCAGKLNPIQHKLFTDYGLRQIKWMFEKDTVMQSKIPSGAVLIGLSQPFSRWTAIDEKNKIRYGFSKDKTLNGRKPICLSPKCGMIELKILSSSIKHLD